MRSTTSLIQTAERAARHIEGRVILYADNITDSIRQALDISKVRREKQMAYNEEHGITPRSVARADQVSLHAPGRDNEKEPQSMAVAEDSPQDVHSVIAQLESEMLEAANSLEFEKAAMLRDQIQYLKTGDKPKTYRRGKKYKQGA